mgnify:CR=1 FL=1
MKKDEFFAQLRTAFAGMDEELLTDILGDYENHFKEGIENGKSEEEICEELGNVEEIRQAFLDENPAAMTINVNSNSQWVILIFITVFIQAFSVSMLSSQMPILKSKRAIQMR